MQSEHLKASRNRKEEDRRRKEHFNVMVCQAYRFEANRGCHFGYRFLGISEAKPSALI